MQTAIKLSAGDAGSHFLSGKSNIASMAKNGVFCLLLTIYAGLSLNLAGMLTT